MAPTQNTIIPFTRNAVGPMDYTPVALSDSTYPHQTTNGHELALSVIFESGLQHMADKVSAYRDLPDAPKEFLKKVPAAWDDTLLLNGRPGDFVVLARRKGEVWYVAGINGRKNPLEIAMDYASLDLPTDCRATFITDGADARSFASSNGRPEHVKLMPFGGFVLRLEP
jgi:alpha-glucosidase